MGVKSQFCSNLHQIWWEGASLQAIKESFNFLTLSSPFDPPRRVQGRSMGVKPLKFNDVFSSFHKDSLINFDKFRRNSQFSLRLKWSILQEWKKIENVNKFGWRRTYFNIEKTLEIMSSKNVNSRMSWQVLIWQVELIIFSNW